MPVAAAHKRILYYTSGLLSLIIFCTPLPTSAATLAVPFTLQAPYSNWSQPWQDACEEAVTLMVDYFYAGKQTARIDKQTAHDELLKIVALENKSFGFDKDTNADQIVEIINNFFPWEAYVVEKPTVAAIRAEIDAGRPVIVPFHGRIVNNPYFLNGGPDYHTAVIKGYNDTTQEFITHDPGIGRGLDYRYPYATLMNALHDFLPNDQTKFGRVVAIFTRPQPLDSALSDGDNDNLTKALELAYGTDLQHPDTDRDGFIDGIEVNHGYSPTVNEVRLPAGSLIKAADNPKVYLLEQGAKRHIINEQVFEAHGWRWEAIVTVGKTFIAHLEEKGAIMN